MHKFATFISDNIHGNSTAMLCVGDDMMCDVARGIVDNGDAISKQYASTAAMKGDYTRTKKRDYRGALTDAGLSLTRFFNG